MWVKVFSMSEGNTCIAEPNLEVLPYTKIMLKTSSFFFVLKNDVWSFDTFTIALLSEDNK